MMSGDFPEVRKSPVLAYLEDDPTQYEENMNTEQAVMRTYAAVMTAFLNISTLKMNQVE